MKRFVLRAVAGCLRFLVFCLLMSGVFSACKAVEIRAPEGFVVYTKLPGSEFRAISAEGIALRVKQTANEPASDVTLWSRSLKLNLESRGYVVRSEEPIEAAGLKGSVLKSATRIANQDFGYICALFVSGRDLYFVEAAGAYPEFAAKEAQILDSIRSFKPRPGLL